MLNKKTINKLIPIFVLLFSVMGTAITQENTSLTISFPGDLRSETVNSLIDTFVAMKAKQGVIVEVSRNEPTEAYNDQLLLDFSAGVGPDVFSISAETIPEFVVSELIMPLDDLVAAWNEWSYFPAGMQAMPSMNGSVYAIMYNTDTRVLFYRKDILEAAGIASPFHPQSWDDIFAAAKAIKEKVPDVIPMEVESGTIWGEGTTMDGFFMLFRGADGQLFDPTDGKWIVESPALLDAFTFYETMFAEGYSKVEPFMEPQPWVYWLQEGLAKGDVGMAVAVDVVWGLYAPDGAWGVPNRDTVLAWTPMPARESGAGVNGSDYVGMGGGWGWAISSNTQNPDLAWEFVKFMSSADSISRYAKDVGGIPTRLDASADNEHVSAITQQVMPYQSYRPLSPDYNRISEQIQIATEKIMLGEANAEEAMAEFGTAVEEIVGSENVKRLPMK